MESESLRRGDRVCLTREQFTAILNTMNRDIKFNNPRELHRHRQQLLYAWGLREDIKSAPCCYMTCVVIYPKRFMIMKLRHGI